MKRKTSAFILIFLFVGNMFIFSTLHARAGVKVEPAKLVIDMLEGYPDSGIHYNIRVTNPFSYDIQATSQVIHPYSLRSNYIRIPDLSWIEVKPEELTIPANSSKEFEMFIDIPDEEKPLHYNEGWEIWVIITPKCYTIVDDDPMGITFQTRLAATVLIHTPPWERKMQIPLNIYFILLPIFVFIALFIVLSYMKKKRNVKTNRAAIFYIKEKKSKIRDRKT